MDGWMFLKLQLQWLWVFHCLQNNHYRNIIECLGKLKFRQFFPSERQGKTPAMNAWDLWSSWQHQHDAMKNIAMGALKLLCEKTLCCCNHKYKLGFQWEAQAMHHPDISLSLYSTEMDWYNLEKLSSTAFHHISTRKQIIQIVTSAKF